MSLFQRAYDFFKNLTTPPWLKRVLGITLTILEEAILIIGREAYAYLQTLIIAESKKDIPGQQKLINVYNGFKENYTWVNISDHLLNLIIEALVAFLKREEIID